MVENPGGTGFAVVAEIAPQPGGSAVTMWLASQLEYRGVGTSLMKGCE